MFVLSQSDAYKWPVTVSTPVDGGKFQNHTFTAVFKRLTQTRIQEIASAEGQTDKDIAREVVTGFEDINDADGTAIPFTSSTLERLLDAPGVASAIVHAFMASLTGAKRKN